MFPSSSSQPPQDNPVLQRNPFRPLLDLSPQDAEREVTTVLENESTYVFAELLDVCRIKFGGENQITKMVEVFAYGRIGDG
jgi:hypothetical protein